MWSLSPRKGGEILLLPVLRWGLKLSKLFSNSWAQVIPLEYRHEAPHPAKTKEGMKQRRKKRNKYDSGHNKFSTPRTGYSNPNRIQEGEEPNVVHTCPSTREGEARGWL